jgi:FixJ family two-component response regulator
MQAVFPQAHLVYVVDDELSVCRSLGRLLRSLGLRSREFGSARELLTDEGCAEAACFVIDVHMPEMGGYELVKRLEEAAPASPVILITARAEESDRWREKAASALVLLLKPFSDQELITALKQALQPHSPPRMPVKE